jgi:hypothetical protein
MMRWLEVICGSLENDSTLAEGRGAGRSLSPLVMAAGVLSETLVVGSFVSGFGGTGLKNWRMLLFWGGNLSFLGGIFEQSRLALRYVMEA